MNSEMIKKIEDNLYINYPKLLGIKDKIHASYLILEECYKNKNKVLVCGNGGSAADSEHIVGELMKGFLMKREASNNRELVEKFNKVNIESSEKEYLIKNLQLPLTAISLVSQTSLITAYANDVDANMIFAQQVLGYGSEGDVLIALSTSGNSKNIVNAVNVARALGLKTISITGHRGGILKDITDVCMNIEESETYKIQEYTLPIYHALCSMLEYRFF